MGNVVIQNPPQYTEQIPKWDRETLADGEAMGQVIEQLANNDAYLKKELERQEHVELITLTAAGWTEESGLLSRVLRYRVFMGTWISACSAGWRTARMRKRGRLTGKRLGL